jgi:hypothetical protein
MSAFSVCRVGTKIPKKTFLREKYKKQVQHREERFLAVILIPVSTSKSKIRLRGFSVEKNYPLSSSLEITRSLGK